MSYFFQIRITPGKLCALVLMLLTPMAPLSAVEFHQTSALWQQVNPKLGVVLGTEREVYEFSDQSGRFVVALQCGQGARPEDFEGRWVVRHKEEKIAEGSGSLAQGMLVVDFDLAGLAPGTYEVTAEVLRAGQEVAVEKRSFEVQADSTPPVAKKGRVPLILPAGIPGTANGYPVAFGVPFPKGALPGLSQLRVVDAGGREIPAQFQVRAQWGSRLKAGIRWLGVDVQMPETAPWWPERRETPLFLEYGQQEAKVRPESLLQVESGVEGIRVDTGPLAFLVRSDGFNLIDKVTLNGASVLDQGGGGGAYVVDQEGTVYRAANDRKPSLTVEESGPLRAVIRVEGWYVKEGTSGAVRNFRLPTEALCKFITRIEAYAGLPWVRIVHNWINTSDSYSVFFKDVGFSLLRPGNVTSTFGVTDGKRVDAKVEPGGVYLLQHLSDQFKVRREDGTVLAKGAKSDGTVQALASGGKLLSLANRDTWQRFPKELEVLPEELRFHLWPAHGQSHPEIDPFARDRFHQLWFAHQGQLMDLRFPWETLFAVMRFTDNPSLGIYKPGGTAMGGVQSSAMGIAITADFMVYFGNETQTDAARQDMAAFEAHPIGAAAPQWVADSGTLGPIHPYDPERFGQFEKAAENAIQGVWNLQNLTGEYGMFLYRSWHHGKYVGNGYWEPYRLYSAGHHYEPYLPWLYFARSGDPRYEEIGMAGMRQLTDLGITHYADPAYEHREFSSGQKKLVGATGHSNGFVLWGGDHAILGHLTSYGAIMLAYYITGDLRFREVVTEEWQRTLLEDRLNPEWAKASRMNWGVNVPEINRDNNQGLGEMLDLYQLTYDPRLLALIQPCVQSMEQNMYQWSRELQSVLAFRRSPKLKDQLVEAAELRRVDSTNKLYNAFNSLDGRRYALAAWADPARGFEKDALWAASRMELVHAPMGVWEWEHPSTETFKVADEFLELPMIMGVSKSVIKPGWREDILPPQKLPVASELGGTIPSIIVVNEEDDGEFSLTFQGKIASATARVTVTAPDGHRVLDEPLPAGNKFSVKIPKDGMVGDYVVAALLQAEQDSIRLPISSLKHEVYVTSYWMQADPQCFFIGAANREDGAVEISPDKNAFTLESGEEFRVIGERVVGDYEVFQCVLPRDGAWLITSGGRYFTTPKTAPLVLSLNPGKFFLPAYLSTLP